jgi:hypothetical protein
MMSGSLPIIHEDLIRYGSTAALVVRGYGEDRAAQAMQELTDAAPAELGGAWMLVIAWHRAQSAYEVAAELGDTKGMLAAAKQQSDLVKDLH